MNKLVAFAIAIVMAGPALAAEQDSEALAKATQGFYDVYMTLHPSDGIPDDATRAKFEPYVSPALNALFVAGHEAEQRYAKATKSQSPPLVEGDLFTPNFEGATSYRIGSCGADARGGHCAVTLSYDDRKDKPIIWTDTALLVHTPSGWRLDNIAYGGNGEFGNRGTLTETLKDAIRNGNEFSR